MFEFDLKEMKRIRILQLSILLISMFPALLSGASVYDGLPERGINLLDEHGEREGWWFDSVNQWHNCKFFCQGQVAGIYVSIGGNGDIVIAGDERPEKGACYMDGLLLTDILHNRDTLVSGSSRIRSIGGNLRKCLAVSFYDDGSIESEKMICYEHLMADYYEYGHCTYYYKSGCLKETKNYEKDGDLREVRRYDDGTGRLRERVRYDANGVLQCKELYGGGELVEVVEYKDGTDDLQLDYHIRTGYVQRTETYDADGVRRVTLSSRKNAERRLQEARLGINKLNERGYREGWWKVYDSDPMAYYADGFADGPCVNNNTEVCDVWNDGHCCFQSLYWQLASGEDVLVLLYNFRETRLNWQEADCTFFYADGRVMSEGRLVVVGTYPCGDILSEIHIDSRQTGRWVYYNPDGTVARTRDFVGDEVWDLIP